jgi:lysophospholipase L1-like esterase
VPFAHAGFYLDGIETTNGAAAANVPVTVKVHGTATLAVLYTDRTKTATAPNPTTTDGNGNLAVYADPGLYDCTANGGTFTILVPADPADYGSGTPGANGAAGAAGATGVPAVRGLFGTQTVPVASNTTVYPNPGSGSAGLPNDGGRFASIKHVVGADAFELRLVFGNHYTQQSIPGEVAGPNDILVRASVEYPSGVPRLTTGSTAYSASTAYVVGDKVTYSGNSYVAKSSFSNQTPQVGGTVYWDQVQFFPVHFPGESASRDVTIRPGQVVVSEPIGVDIVKGAVLYTNTLVQPNNGTANTGQYPVGQSAAAATDYTATALTGAAPVDYTLTGPTSVASAGAMTVYGPMAVVGVPKNGAGSVPSIALVGDSIMAGSNDSTQYGNEPGGWGIRAFGGGQFSHMRIARGGDKAQFFTGAGSRIRRLMLGGATHVIVEYGTNDLGTVADLATMKARLQAIWDSAAARGARVYQATITPQTDTTDAYATSANQTARAGFGAASIWSQLNDWIRTTPAPLTGYLDVAAAVTDATVTWAWKPGYTTDGTHPNATAHAAMAATVNTGLFTAPGNPQVGAQGPQGIQGTAGAAGAAGAGYTTVKDLAGAAVTQRTVLKFAGSGVAVADTAGETVVTVTGGGGGSVLNLGALQVPTTAALAETIPRGLVITNLPGFTSGTLFLTPVLLTAGQVITSVTFYAGGTAVATPTNQWFGLFDSSRNAVALTADATTAAWAGFAKKTLALTASYTVPATGMYYLGICVAATTMMSLNGLAPYNGNVQGEAPVLSGNSTAALTGPPGLPFTAGALSTTLKALPYAYVS